MKWYYYEPLSYYRYFLVVEFEDKLGVIEVDYDNKHTIFDFDYNSQNMDFIENKDLKTPLSENKRKLLKLLEKESHKLIPKIFTNP